MSAVLTLPRGRDVWTVDDLDGLPDDGLRYELVDGALLVSPPAPNPHNVIASRLAFRLRVALDDEWEVITPGSVRLDEHNRREPDVLVLAVASAAEQHAPPAATLLVVEVMSPSSVDNDRVRKPSQYARAGIPHYWRVEPVKPVLVTYRLDGVVYRETGRFDDQVVIDEPAALHFRLADLLP